MIEEKKRKKILNGNILNVIFTLTFPIFLYNLVNALYLFIDAKIVSDINTDSINAIFFFDQIKNTIGVIGSGLASSGSLLIARKIGSNNFKLAKKYTNILVVMVTLVAISIVLLCIPGLPIIFKISNSTETLQTIGKGYFIVQLVTTALSTFNAIYISIEKITGKTGNIFSINIICLIVKFVFTYLFVKVFFLGLTSVAVATLLSQLSITVVALYKMTRKHNMLKLEINFRKVLRLEGPNCLTILKELLTLSLPIMLGSFLINFAKVIFNSMCIEAYGEFIIGALGISATINTFFALPVDSIEQTEGGIIAQNVGNNNHKRALKTHYTMMGLIFSISAVMIIISLIFIEPLTSIFVDRSETQYFNLVCNMYRFEAFNIFLCAIAQSSLAYLNANGKTQFNFICNLIRVLFRLPLLYVAIYYIEFGELSSQLSLTVSNIAYASATCIIVLLFVKNLKERTGLRNVNSY